MHMQPLYRESAFVTMSDGNRQTDVGADVFERSLCLPSDIKMTDQEQAYLIEVIRKCFE